jgi:outer membrane protein/adhesin transport system outer membrane protein
LQAENTLIDDRATYERLVGEEPGVLHVPALKASNHTMKDVMHRSETINPSVIDAEFTYEAANNDVNLNIGSLLPEIDLVGTQAHSYGQSVVYPGRQDNTQVMLQMTFPLYDGGESYSKIREARQTATQRRMELEETRHKSVEQARAAWQALLTAEAAIKADEAEIDSAGKALEGVKTEARVGSRTTIDVLNAEQELLDAKTDITNAHHDRDYALLQIRSAIGELTADAMQLPVNVYDPDEHYSDNTWKPIGFGDDDDYVVGERNKMAALDKKDEERALAPEPEAAPATDPVPEAAPQPPVEAVPEAAPTTEAP